MVTTRKTTVVEEMTIEDVDGDVAEFIEQELKQNECSSGRLLGGLMSAWNKNQRRMMILYDRRG